MNYQVEQEIRMDVDRAFSASANIISLLVFVLLALFVPQSHAQEKITIGLLPEMNVFAQVKRFQPLADYLSRETGVTIQISILSRYSDIVEDLRLHKVDAAFLGSFTAALAISELKAIPVARPVNLDNTSTYNGLIFVRKDSGIRNAGDMRGKTMAFVERSTTAGYIFPLAWLKQKGIEDVSTFFKDFFFTGSHDSAVDAVMKKKADIGAAKNTIYEYFLEANPLAKEGLVVIASSESVPSNGLCVTQSVKKETVTKLQEALLRLDKSTDGKSILNKLRALRFVETNSADYAPVVELVKEAGITFEAYLKKTGGE